MGAVLILLLTFAVGFIAGYLNKGINVTYNKIEGTPLVPDEQLRDVQMQNDELAGLLDPSVQKWFQENNGMIK